MRSVSLGGTVGSQIARLVSCWSSRAHRAAAGGGGLQLGGAGGLPVQGGVAELTGVGGGLPVAGDEVAAGELADEVVGGGVVGAPAAVDDLGVVARVIGVGEVGAVRQQPQRSAVAKLPQCGDGRAGFGDGGRRGWCVPDGDFHPGGAGGGDEPAGAGQVGPVPAAVGGRATGVGAVAEVAGQVGGQDLAGRLGGKGAAIAGNDLAAV